MPGLLRFVWMAWNAYRSVGENGVHYSAVQKNGVPNLIFLLGTGREAWRVSVIAADTCQPRCNN